MIFKANFLFPLELPTNEEYGTITTQEKDDICRDKTGVPFQATENMQSSIDQCF